MTNKFHISAISILFMLLIISCSKPQETTTEIEIPVQIKKIIPDSVLNTIKSLNISINTGDNPPLLNNSYIAKPFVLDKSTIQTDSLKSVFSDFELKIFNQQNENISLSLEYKQGYESAKVTEAYITGKDSLFTIYFKSNSSAFSSVAEITHIISGISTTNGIKQLHCAMYMNNNYGNNSIWISNKNARLFIDSDGISTAIAH